MKASEYQLKLDKLEQSCNKTIAGLEFEVNSSKKLTQELGQNLRAAARAVEENKVKQEKIIFMLESIARAFKKDKHFKNMVLGYVEYIKKETK